jgi:hypothetical protein
MISSRTFRDALLPVAEFSWAFSLAPSRVNPYTERALMQQSFFERWFSFDL